MSSVLKMHPLLWKLPIVVLVFGMIIAAASLNLFPNVSLVAALLYAIAGGVAFLGMVSIGIIVASRVNAYVLTQGGTDTQWLWFNSDPQGLVSLRKQAGTNDDDAVQEPEPHLRNRGV